MAKEKIPVLTTHDLWKKYVKTGGDIQNFFRDNPDDFLITRLEETRHLVTLPTTPHRREVNELVFVTKGRCVRGCDLNKIEIDAGEIHLSLPNQILTVDYLSHNVTGFYCHFSLEAIIKLYHKEHMINELSWLNKQMKSGPVKLSRNSFISVKNIFRRILNEYKTNNEANLIDAYLVTLCYEIKSSIQKEPRETPVSKSFDITGEFKNLIGKNITSHKPIAFYADKLHISANHLNKVVRETTGKSASALIAEMLTLEARVLLKHSELSIGEIAYRLGFVDQSYFSRFFKQQTKITPKQYRKNQ